MRLVAGLEEVTEGSITIGSRNVTYLHPRLRDTAMIFQNYALYPHMSVRKNLGYGLKVRRTPKAEIKRRVDEVARMLGLEELLDRRPSALSGGQRQRVAMGRAIVREPRVFLMDEPLSNLDAKLRVSMRSELARLHDRLQRTTIYVTHDQVEAMTLGDRVAVMRDGQIQQMGTADELYRFPVNLYVATFIGSPEMNLARAQYADGVLTFGGLSFQVEEAHEDIGERHEVIVGIRPEAFVDAALANSSFRVITVTPTVVERLGAEVHAIFPVDVERVETEATRAAREDADSGQLLVDSTGFFTARLPADSSAREDRPLELALDSRQFHFFDAASGNALRRSQSNEGVDVRGRVPEQGGMRG
jgi:multiple sugar transport system ATP-binding protein